MNILLALFTILSVLFAGCTSPDEKVIVKYQEEPSASEEVQQDVIEDRETETNEAIASEANEWNTFSSSSLGFSFNFPSNFTYKEEGSFGVMLYDPNLRGDFKWGVRIFDADALETQIAQMGQQFGDRNETREYVSLNDGRRALKVTVTTASVIDWEFIQIFVTSGDKLYALTNGAIKDAKFERFYKSFELN